MKIIWKYQLGDKLRNWNRLVISIYFICWGQNYLFSVHLTKSDWWLKVGRYRDIKKYMFSFRRGEALFYYAHLKVTFCLVVIKMPVQFNSFISLQACVRPCVHKTVNMAPCTRFHKYQPQVNLIMNYTTLWCLIIIPPRLLIFGNFSHPPGPYLDPPAY